MLGLALLALRLVLPRVVAPLVAARLSRALGTQLEIGDLSCQPLDAIVTLRDVTVHAPAPPGSPADPTPPIVADRVRIDLQWLPLLHRTLEVRKLALESARVDVDRFPDGGFGLANLERADPASELPAGWSFALDRIAARDSRLRVRDPAVGGAVVLEATLRDADVSGLRQRATAFGKATNLRVDALVSGGQLRVHGRYELRDDGLGLDAVMRVKDVPLAQLKSYVTDLGWTDLSGQLSGQLRWQREPRRRDLLSGRLVLRRGSVQVANLTEPALGVPRGVAEIAAIDFLKRRIAIESVTLHGATLAVRPDVGAPIPLIVAPLARPAARGGRRDARAESASRWSWMIERFDTADGRVRVLVPDGQFDLRARASGENLGPGAYWSPLRIEVAHHEAAAAFDGTMRLADGVTIEGHLTAAEIDFAGLARAAALPWAELVRAGRAAADLTVQFDSATEKASPLYARGDIGLTDLWIAGPDPGAFAFGAASVDLTVEGFSPREPGRAGDRGNGHPTRIRFSDANVGKPFVLLTRTIDGWILPPFAPAIGTSPDEGPEIVLDAVRGDGGRLTVVDQVPTPAVTWDVTRLDGSARSLSLPAFTFDDLQLHGSDPTFGDLELGGSRRSDTSRFEVSGERVPLAATAPYLTLAGLPYRFASGRGSFSARGSIGRKGWRADTALTLQTPVLVDSDAALQRAIGMPISAALALLRDQSGDVTLQVALAPPRADGRDTYAGRVAAGVRDAIRRVREAAEMKDIPAFRPVDVLFPPGQFELTLPAMQDLAPVAKLLGSRPGLAVELAAETSQEDRRWLAEQALLEELEPSGGVMDVLRVFGVRGARDRIRVALAARARGAPGLLEPGDEALLGQLLAEAPAVDDSQLAGLREARLTRVVNHLADHYGITGKRVVVRSVAPRGGAALPAVRVQVTIGPDPAIDLRGSSPPAAAGSMGSPGPAPWPR